MPIIIKYLNNTETEDSYYTVILKEISAFHWILESYKAHRSESRLKWVIKMDDDVIINPINLQRLLQQHESELAEEKLFCENWAGGVPIRDAKSKW